MLKKIKNIALVIAASASILAPGLVPALAGTASASIKESLCTGVSYGTGDATGNTCGTAGQGDGTAQISTIAGKIVNIFSIIVGVIAVIMIIYGGFRYITSGGDSGKVGNAKNSLIYAIIGLIIVALAQVIVHYVINTAAGAAGGAT